MKKIIRFLTSKVTIIAFLALIQIAIFILAVYFLADLFTYFITFSTVLSFLLVFLLLRSDEPETYKLAWILPMVLFPVFGGLFYLTFKPVRPRRKLYKNYNLTEENRKKAFLKKEKEICEVEDDILKQVHYLKDSHWPCYKNTKLTFFPSGESKFEEVLKQLKNAKSSIFIEYFILQEDGKIFQSILSILEEKVQQGVDVRIIYDDWGSSLRINRSFKKRMEKLGIKIVIFNPLNLRVSVSLNYRDHKKIIVIDNNIAFTGGINLADEYANIIERFGHWNDAAIMLEGEAVYSLTAAFLQSWDLFSGDSTLLENFKPTTAIKDNSLIIPYTDVPFSKKFLSRNLFLQMLNSAKKEITIFTPYFIIDNEMLNTLETLSLSGIKINIAIPGITDKKIPYIVTKYHLRQLIKLPNVNIYAYEKGFLHSKILLIDDILSIVGTVNFDFRSFYLHFENSVWIYKSDALKDLKTYITDTINKSKLLTYNDLKSKNIFYTIFETFLILFSPLF